MIVFLFIPLLSFLFTSTLRGLLASQSTNLHLLCLKILPPSDHLEVNQALICGENLKSEITRQLFIDTGLYHLIVVSGSHLVLLTTLLEWIFFRCCKNRQSILIQLTMILCFLIYTLMCGLQPPLVRACFSQIILLISRSRKLYLTDTTILLLSIGCCLLFEPQWTKSLSLLLSATASLSLILTNRIQNLFSKQLFIYLCIFPVLFGWGNLHPLTILINVVIAPIVSFFLLPIAILSIPLPFLSTLLDWLYRLTFQILTTLSLPAKSFQDLESKSTSQIFSKNLLWIYFLILCGIQFWNHLRRFRDSK